MIDDCTICGISLDSLYAGEAIEHWGAGDAHVKCIKAEYAADWWEIDFTGPVR